ncbi:MAG: hypothetical protein GF313_02130 [Caldithrix sp.]|nr:hypothetical protein [Caldithrix sp.]
MKPGHFIAIFGGAVAGSEAAQELSKQGIHTVVFEQNALPYGKLESGLPKWHDKLRDRQENMINEKLKQPLVRFIPNIRLGHDVELNDIINEWKFSAVLIATGAWKDRPLPVPDIEKYLNKNFYYQNGFVQWFNGNHDPQYKGSPMEVSDNAIIIGGGLASLDVAKIVMIETVLKALKERGIDENLLNLEKKGIARILESHNLSLEKLGLKGCTLYTRHEIRDMPLNVIPEDATPEEVEKNLSGREKILGKIQDKFLFNIKPAMQATKIIEENNTLKGLIFQHVDYADGRYKLIEGTDEHVYSPMIISAIGSIPAKIPGLPMKDEIYDVENTDTGRIKGYDNVYAMGNAVTGRGNIRQSQYHSRQVSENIVDQYLAWQDEDYEEIFSTAQDRVDQRLEAIGERLKRLPPLTGEQIREIDDRIKRLQQSVGYDGDYDKWIAEHLPPRIEDSLEH